MYKELLKTQKGFFNTGLIDINFRKKILKKLYQVIKDNEEELYNTIKMDLNKSEYETYMCEIGIVLNEITYTLKHIKKWCKVKKVKTPITNISSKSYIVPNAYGNVLIIAPWNYPINLSLVPLVSAIAAGNTIVLKLSNSSINTSKKIMDMINNNFDECYIKAILDEEHKILNERFDYIFYTGSATAGKEVMKKASENLTPVTLELGGKSPCVVLKDADIKNAAKKIVFGKLLNAGQTCIAPDYVLVHKDVKDDLIKYMKEYITLFLGKNPLENDDYPKIINEKHFNRLLNLIKNEKIIFGGKSDKSSLKISPTILDKVKITSTIMKEEIFGPIFPIIEIDNHNEGILYIKSFEKPLALYLFTKDKKIQKEFMNEVSFGGGCINNTIMHLTSHNLPFGGVGSSGMGSYHGKFGFDTFTHYKSISKKGFIDLKIMYHKYDKKNLKLIKWFLK